MMNVKKKLQRQEYCKVMRATSPEGFEGLVRSAAERGMLLHSWNVTPYNHYVALFLTSDEMLDETAYDIPIREDNT